MAIVGPVEVAAETVSRIAAARSREVQAARDLAIRDALLASGARARGLESDPSVARSITSLLARSMIEDLQHAAVAAGPVTDAELAETTQRHWLELDRPEGFVTVHACALADERADAAKKKKAAEVADAIHKAVSSLPAAAAAVPPPDRSARGAATPPPEDALIAKFRDAAQTVPAEGGIEVRIEGLPPVAADGRVLVPGDGTFDPAYAKAVSALAHRGDLTKPFASPFGYHVAMLLERTPPFAVAAERRRETFREEIVTERARAARAELLTKLRSAAEIDRSADALLALVPIE